MAENSSTATTIVSDESFAAVRRAAREEVVRQARLGNSVPAWRNEQVVWVTPEEILARDAEILSRKACE